MERSRFVTVALIGLSLVTVLHLKHLASFTSTHMAVLCLVVVLAHVSAMLCTRTKLLHAISPLVSFFILVVVLLIANSHGSFYAMLPTPDSLTSLIHDIREGVVTLRTRSVPLPFDQSLLLVGIIVAWIIAEVGETLAQRLHSSAPTLLWYLLLNAVIAAQKGSGGLILSILLLCSASWFYLFAFDRGNERARAHVIEIPSAARVSNFTRYVFSLIALIVLSLLLVLPVSSLPSLAPKNIFHFLNNPTQQTELSPLVSMKQQLNSTQREVLFTATSAETQYWRVAVLDDFDGTTWSVNSQTKQAAEKAPVGVQTHALSAYVTLNKLVPKFLPSIYSTQSVSVDRVDYLKGSVLYTTNNKIKNYTLSATVVPSTLTPEQVQQSSGVPPKNVESSLLLPTNFDKKIIAQARTIASNKESIYEQVLALRAFFLDGSFTYDTTVKYSSSTNAMEMFLKDKRGFCEQFATTYAAMARSVGIPARVVVGFTPGQPDSTGRLNITNEQAHSWVEVYLSHFGWLTIDPTPSGPLPGQAPTNIGTPITTTTTTTTTLPGATNSTQTTAKQSATPLTQDKTRSSNSGIPTWIVFALILLALSAGGVILWRKRNRGPKDDGVFIQQAFMDISQRVLELEPEPSLTVHELDLRVPDNNIVIKEFLTLLSLASYSPDSDISMKELRESADRARSEKILVKK